MGLLAFRDDFCQRAAGRDELDGFFSGKRALDARFDVEKDGLGGDAVIDVARNHLGKLLDRAAPARRVALRATSYQVIRRVRSALAVWLDVIERKPSAVFHGSAAPDARESIPEVQS